MAFSILQTTTEDAPKNKSGGGNTPTATPVKKRRIELSPLPIHVNKGVRLDEFLSASVGGESGERGGGGDHNALVVRGRIVSVEDHGCIVDLGGIGATATGTNSGGGGQQAFLKFENIEGDYEIVDDDSNNESNENTNTTTTATKSRLINPHRIYDFSLSPTLQSGSTSILQLSLPTPTTLSKLRITHSKMAPSLSSLMPGMLMEVNVEQHAKNGICVSFMRGVYRGAVDEDHLGGWRSDIGSGDGNSRKKRSLNDDVVVGDGSMWWKSVFKGRHAKVSCWYLTSCCIVNCIVWSIL